MEFDYELEKAKLKKKLIIVIGLFIVFMVIFCGIAKVGLGWGLATSLAMALVLYIPGRLKEVLKIRWFWTIVLTIAYIYLYIFLVNKIGNFVAVLLLVPLADIGYSIYKVASYKG